MYKTIIAITAAIVVATGCASHAEIKSNALAPVTNARFDNSTITYEVLYSQPQPGMFSDGEQLPLKPLAEAEVSVGSARTLRELPNYLFAQLPPSAKRGSDDRHDYKLRLALIAKHKAGPVYADYQYGETFGKKMLTLGLAPDEFEIVADFDARLQLLDANGQVVHERDYQIAERVEHERDGFENMDNVTLVVHQLFEQQLTTLLHDFLSSTPV